MIKYSFFILVVDSFMLSVLSYGTFQSNILYSLISHSFPCPLQSELSCIRIPAGTKGVLKLGNLKRV